MCISSFIEKRIALSSSNIIVQHFLAEKKRIKNFLNDLLLSNGILKHSFEKNWKLDKKQKYTVRKLKDKKNRKKILG